MSASKRREAAETTTAEAPPELVYRLTRKGGGVVLEECEATITRVVRAKPPDALAIVLARLSGWVETRFSR